MTNNHAFELLFYLFDFKHEEQLKKEIITEILKFYDLQEASPVEIMNVVQIEEPITREKFDRLLIGI